MSGHISPVRTYYGIFGALMVLTVVTVAVAFVNLGRFNFPVAIGIAITKATLVILFFMHVKYSSTLTKLIVGMAFFFLAIMLGLTMTDYGSRGWYTSPRGSTTAGQQMEIDPPGQEPPGSTTAAPRIETGAEPAPAEH